VTAFELPDLVIAASRTLGLGTGATVDLLDLAAAEAALAEANAVAAGDDVATAAALLYALVLRRPFRRGNDRVALVATLQLLAVHGYRANLDPPAATTSIIAGISAGEVDAAELRRWLMARVYCESDARQGEKAMRNWLPARRRRARRASASGGGLFGRFTNEARQVVVLSQAEARMLGHNYIGTEHLLLGLIHAGDDVAAQALESLGISLEAVRQQVEKIIGLGQQAPSGHIPFTPRAKKVLQLAKEEAIDHGGGSIAAEHILLGLVREGSGVAAQVLTSLGATAEQVRHEVIRHVACRRAADGLTEPDEGGGQQSA
jgi:prophage maintenance system killer protein